jgi:hypothetical protein
MEEKRNKAKLEKRKRIDLMIQKRTDKFERRVLIKK